MALLISIILPATPTTAPPNLATAPNAFPSDAPSLLELVAAPPCALDSLLAAAAPAALFPPPPAPPVFPPRALRIWRRVSSEAAFLASTSPTPGISIITAIIYFCPVNCAYK